jgi:hypothetical protein
MAQSNKPVKDVKRWIPTVGMSKADFIERAKDPKRGGSPDFDFALWQKMYESALKKQLPQNFEGEGW